MAEQAVNPAVAPERDTKPKNLRLLESFFDIAAGEAKKRFAPLIEVPTRTPDPVPAPAPVQPAKVKPEPVAKKRTSSRLRPRHIAIIATFFVFVLIPSTLASLYLAFIAAPQYHSTASFSVRSIESGQATDLLGMFSQASSGSTVSDSYVLLDLITSERMVRAVDKEFGIDGVFAPRGLDYYYGIGSQIPIEDKVRYWRRMVNVDFDHSSGIMTLQVKSFTPEDSRKIAAFIIQQSERLVNDLSLTARSEVLKVTQNELAVAETRLSDARDAMRNYRDVSQEADPVEGARLATQLVASLEQQLVQLQTELSTALTQMGEDTPRIRVMRSQIGSLKKQIEQEKQRLGSGVAPKQGRTASDGMSGVAGRIQQYDKLETQREFAERAYTSALAALEKARIEVNGKQRYLAVFINPTPSEMAQYPHRLFNSMLVLFATLLIWSVAVMAFYNIRDRN